MVLRAVEWYPRKLQKNKRGRVYFKKNSLEILIRMSSKTVMTCGFFSLNRNVFHVTINISPDIKEMSIHLVNV